MTTFLTRYQRPVLVFAAMLGAFTIAAGAAWAYFTTTGHGTGSAVTATMQNITLQASAGDSTTGKLYPGGPKVDVVVRINNPNSYALTLTDLVLKSGGITGCSTPDVTFTDQHGLNINVPTGSHAIDVPGAIQMGTSATSDCQGANISIPVTATVQK